MKVDQAWKERYRQAHESWSRDRHPNVWADGFGQAPDYPKVGTANGLTRAIENYINWKGWRATRVSSAGRYDGKAKQFIRSTTRKGSADLSATIMGKSLMLEIKVGKDRPSEYQLAEQAKERRAGGMYEFVHTMQEFYDILDRFVVKPELFL